MKKKKLITIIMMIVLMITIGVGMIINPKVEGATWVDPDTGLEWYYELEGTNAVNVYLASGTVSGTTLTIPDTLTENGYTVTSICGKETNRNILGVFADNTITKVIIPNTVEIIGNYTFHYMRGIQEIVIPENVTLIGERAFYYCSALTGNLTLPNSVTSIGNHAFYGCSALTGNLTLPNNLNSIEDSVFYGCSGLTGDLIIPNNVTSIGNHAFYGCSGLNGSLKIPESVGSIGSSAFDGCSGLTGNLIIPEGVAIIKGGAFYNCSGLTGDLIIPNSVKSVGSQAFYNCTGLNGKLVISENLTKIENGTFRGCTGLTGDLVIPSKVKTIEAHAFNGCSGVTGNLVIPNGVTTIGQQAFFNCSGLNGTLTLPEKLKTIEASVFANCSGLTGTLIIPESVTSIGNSAFYGCEGLTGDLNIHDSITSLGTYAFYNCLGLNGTITIGKGIKSISTYTFYNCTNVEKVIIGKNVTNVYDNAFYGFTDVYVDDVPGNITFNTNFAGSGANCNIHYLGQFELNISTLPEVKVINVDTGEVMISSECNPNYSFKYKIVIDSQYNYENLTLVKTENGVATTVALTDENINDIYEVTNLSDDYYISVQQIKQEAEFIATIFADKIGENNLNPSKQPEVVVKNGVIEYELNKTPAAIKTGEQVSLKVRVYNQGGLAGTFGNVQITIPEGIEFDTSNETNKTYKWTKQSNVLTSDYLVDKQIAANNGTISYQDIELVVKVSAEYPQTEILEIKMTAEEMADSEYFIFAEGVEVKYKVKLSNLDVETSELLLGAKFRLENENGIVFQEKRITEEGTLIFDEITTFGAGQDIYYISEIETPEGYAPVEGIKVKLAVVKTIDDLGNYSLQIICDTLDTRLEMNVFEYVPIKTREHLEKIGSGEIVTIDGINYKYSDSAIYKLMNDIDLSGANWNPINTEFKGVLNGDNHKIANLKINTEQNSEIAEIGMFRVVSGEIKNLTLENVDIYVKNINEEATGVTSYQGIGALTGVMKGGTIYNCTVSGKITGGTDNIGGFIGHTVEGYRVIVKNSINNANVTGIDYSNYLEGNKNSSNVGGFIGCALGTLRMFDCTNNGIIQATGFNAGGLVGCVEAREYEEISINAEYADQENLINVTVKNKKVKGKYAVELENVDAQSLGLIEGAIYTVYNSNKEVIQGCERIQLEEGKLRIATIDINSLGKDEYYIEEIESAAGYEGLNGVVKLVVERYWDAENSCYKVIANAEILTNSEMQESESEATEIESSSATGIIAAEVVDYNVVWNVNKVEFKNCTNNGTVEAGLDDAAGIIAKAQCLVDIDNCSNTAEIRGAKAAGIVAELNTNINYSIWGREEYTSEELFNKINNSNNSGYIYSNGVRSAAGIIAYCPANIELNNCVNTGEVYADSIESNNYAMAAGIIADSWGIVKIDNCINEGKITSNRLAAGILAQQATQCFASSIVSNNLDDYQAYISNCINRGDLVAGEHVAGILAATCANIVEIQNCKTENCTIQDYNGVKGGIVGKANSKNIMLKDCIVENIIMEALAEEKNSDNHATAGIIADCTSFSAYGNKCSENITIESCKVLGSTITTINGSTAGIIGFGYDTNSEQSTQLYINNCSVEECEIESTINNNLGSYWTLSSGGVLGEWYNISAINITNTTVKKSTIQILGSARSQNLGGIIGGLSYDVNKVNFNNVKVEETDVINNVTGPTSGMVGFIYDGGEGYDVPEIKFSNCEVVNSNILNKGTFNGTCTDIGGFAANIYVYQSQIPGGKVIMEGCNIKNTIIEAAMSGTNSSQSGNNVGGLIGFLVAPQEVKIEKCNVNENTKISGNARNLGGYLGGMCMWGNNTSIQIGNGEIKNCNITGSYDGTETYSTIGGVFGAIQGTGGIANISNINVTECEIYSPHHKSVAGMIGSGTGIITDCNVTNTNITSERFYEQNDQFPVVAGVIASIYDQSMEISNTVVTGCNIKGKAVALGGIAGTTSQNLTIKNSEVLNTNIDDLNSISAVYLSNGRACGGFVGVKASDKLEISDSNVNNVSITFPNDRAYANAGGLVGFIKNNNNNILNSHVKQLNINIKATSSGNVGGFVGMTDYNQSTGAFATLNISNSTIDNKSSLYRPNGNLGGIIGFGNIVVDNVKVSGTEMSGATNIGGVIGITSAVTSNDDISVIQNSEVNGVNITSTTATRIGGIMGVGNANISNSKVLNSKIEQAANGNSLDIGGVAGNIANTHGISTIISELSGLTVDNIDIIVGSSPNSNVGGIAGNSGTMGCSLVLVNNPTVLNSEISCQGASSYVGGMFGKLSDTGTLTNGQVNNTTLVGTSNVGGITAWTSASMDNCDVTESTIKGTAENATNQYGVGGISGQFTSSSSEVKNCDVSDSEISTNSGYIGGIAGFANNIIDTCTVTGTDIIVKVASSSVSNDGIGGIVGHGSNTPVAITTIKNSTVKDTVLGGVNYVGGIAGSSVASITNSKVLGSVTEKYYDMEGNELTTEAIDGLVVGTDYTVQKEYTTTITGTDSVGGILGDAGVFSGTTVTLTNCEVNGAKIQGTTNVKVDIGQGSRDGSGNAIADVVTGLITALYEIVN